jgi:uncharacterized membrane protein YfcA
MAAHAKLMSQHAQDPIAHMPSLPVLALLVLAAGLAGFVDAAVGGGGLIQLPALLLAFPGQAITTLLGTNKVVSATGTTFAAAQYLRARVLPWREMVGPVLAALLGSAAGVGLAYLVEGQLDACARPAIVVLMIAMLAFTLLKPDLGRLHAPRFGLRHQRGLTLLIAATMGVYDGLFGPGMGTLLIFLFVAVLGFDFLRASALAKSVNWASNAAALVIFLSRGSWLPLVALCMAVANGLGGYLGARTALAKGNRWLRLVFIVVVSGLILRLGWQALG